MTAAAHDTRSRSVVEAMGVVLHDAGGPGDADPQVLLGLALRRNPRRAQLLVSQVLGKHVPTDPRLVRAAGLLLGARVADVLDGRTLRPLPVDALHAAMYPGSKPPSRESNVLQVLVSRVRRKLAAAGHKHAIETIRLRGYRFVMPQGGAA